MNDRHLLYGQPTTFVPDDYLAIHERIYVGMRQRRGLIVGEPTNVDTEMAAKPCAYCGKLRPIKHEKCRECGARQ